MRRWRDAIGSAPQPHLDSVQPHADGVAHGSGEQVPPPPPKDTGTHMVPESHSCGDKVASIQACARPHVMLVYNSVQTHTHRSTQSSIEHELYAVHAHPSSHDWLNVRPANGKCDFSRCHRATATGTQDEAADAHGIGDDLERLWLADDLFGEGRLEVQ